MLRAFFAVRQMEHSFVSLLLARGDTFSDSSRDVAMATNFVAK